MKFSSVYEELFYSYNRSILRRSLWDCSCDNPTDDYLQSKTPLSASGWWDTHPIEYPLDHITWDSVERFAMMSSFEYPL